MKKNYQAQFIRIGKISGIYYSVPGRKTNRIVVYGRGAPLPPDNGKLDDAPFILDYDVDLYVPDYIGYGRSEGEFIPTNCIKTFLFLYDALTKGVTGVCNYENSTKELKYKEIHFIGASFGGIYVPLLPKFNKKITNICAFFPLADWKSLGKNIEHKEETVEGFYRAMKGDGYQYLYRGILKPIWKKHFEGTDGLNPIDNLKHLRDAKVFLAHGKKDINIYYGNTERYYKELVKMFPERKKQYKLKLYPYDHGDETSKRAVVDYFTWMNIPKK